MKDYKRLKVAAVCGNTPSGVVGVDMVEYDGGDFELHPKIYPGGLVLVDPNRPASYGLQITGTSETLKALANALLAASKMTDGSDAAEE